MTRLRLSFVLCCLALAAFASGSLAEGWKKTSSCNVQAIGKSDVVSADNVYTYAIDDWKPDVKYIFHGELSWNTNLGNTQGRIMLKKEGTSLNQRIADWSNPPAGAEIDEDITRYIDSNGTYVVEWVYMGGKSGVCIMKSEIIPSRQ